MSNRSNTNNTPKVTDAGGYVYQYLFYSPFGESLYSQHAQTGEYNTPHRFNANELDPETGNYYYGARYYNPRVSVWLSVDPKAYAFPHATPYNYMLNNPVMMVDPGGDSAYVLNKNGEISLIEGEAGLDGGSNFDILYNDDGKNSLTLPSGIINTGAYEKMTTTVYGRPDPNDIALFSFTDNAGMGLKFYNFVAKNSDVEFSISLGFSFVDNPILPISFSDAIVTTSYQPGEELGGQMAIHRLFYSGCQEVMSRHNHPEGGIPSEYHPLDQTKDGDKTYSEKIIKSLRQSGYPAPFFFVDDFKNNKSYQFDPNGYR